MSYFSPIIIFVITGLVLFPIFTIFIKRFPSWVSFLFLFLTMTGAIFTAFYTIVTFGGAFGPGLLLFLSSVVVTFIGILIWMFSSKNLFEHIEKKKKNLYILGSCIIIFAQFSPVIGKYGIGGYCDIKITQFGNSIVVAIQEYKHQNNVYPTTLYKLKPEYFQKDPVYSCMGKIGISHETLVANFYFQECNEKPSLVTSSTDGVYTKWYDLTTGQWSKISWLDSNCR